jgi:PAS domain-containing protein
VILRVFRGAFAPEHRDRVLAHIRDVVYPSTAALEGLRSFQAGLASGDDERVEFAVISTWDNFEWLARAIGPDLERPAWLRGIEDLYRPRGAEHLELVGEQVKGVFPLEGAILRVFRGRLTAQAAETFFDFARRRQTELIDQGLILASHIGRRFVGATEEAVYVVLWRDAEAIAELGGLPGEPAAREEWAGFFETWELGGYDALTRIAPRGGSEPALLLTDNDRRYVFATAAAGRLIGRSVGRILGERVEMFTSPGRLDRIDGLWASFLTDGSLEGEHELMGRDGSVQSVRFAARANTPWPGCHTSVLVPAGAELGPDAIDDALSEIGIMARYPAPGD